MPLGHEPWSDQPWQRAYDAERPEMPNDPRNITDDEFMSAVRRTYQCKLERMESLESHEWIWMRNGWMDSVNHNLSQQSTDGTEDVVISVSCLFSVCTIFSNTTDNKSIPRALLT